MSLLAVLMAPQLCGVLAAGVVAVYREVRREW